MAAKLGENNKKSKCDSFSLVPELQKNANTLLLHTDNIIICMVSQAFRFVFVAALPRGRIGVIPQFRKAIVGFEEMKSGDLFIK